MKINVLLFLNIFLVFKISAQDFANLNLSQLCNISSLDDFDPFFVGRNNINCTLPWEVSHGTPQLDIVGINQTKKILMYSANHETNGIESEGVFFRYKFKKNRRYKLRFDYSGTTSGLGVSIDKPNPTDKFSCYFANGLNTVTTTSSINSLLNGRSYEVPNVSSKQLIHLKEQVHGDQPQFEKEIFPDNDYDFLWFFPNDNDKARKVVNAQGVIQNNSEGGAVIYLWNVEIVCDNDIIANLTIPKTELISSTGYSYHQQLKTLNQATNIVSPCTTGPVVIKGNSYNQPGWGIFRKDGEKILEASSKIEIFQAFRNSNSTFFEAERGSSFEARIRPICLRDECGDYIPFYEAPILFMTTGVNPFSTTTINRTFFVLDRMFYPKPYNAFKAKLIIANRWGQSDETIYINKTWENRKNGLTDKEIKWTPDPNIAYGNNALLVILEIENCEEIREFRGYLTVVSGLKPDDGNPMAMQALNLVSTGRKGEMSVKSPSASLFPSTTNDIINVKLTLSNDVNNMNFSIFDVNGRKILEDNTGTMEIGEYQRSIDVSKLSQGIYFLKMEGSQTKMPPMKFVKI